MVHAAADSIGREDPRDADALARRQLRCRGTVQGVGFRPAAFRLARALGLAGSVRNDAEGATIEVEGPRAAVDAFVARLRESLPPLACLDALEIREQAPRREHGFRVEESSLGPRHGARIPPDASLCADCRSEMDDPGNRRHRYAFTTCTNCGPRFSLSLGLPYDRERTSMQRFPLCQTCQVEYEAPEKRRFHAEATCCPACGPRLWLAATGGNAQAEGDVVQGEAALHEAREALARGETLAVKGLGGFQLACRSDAPRALRRLRAAKRRPSKPFAVMARDLATAQRIAHLSGEDGELLASPRAPILLAPRRGCDLLCEEIAPGLDDVGVMLPTTPLHVELFRGAPFATLVMTSGNAGDEPIARTNDEALEALQDFAQHFLLHDREVVRRVDDSVLRSTSRGCVTLRRSRGFVPEPVRLPVPTPEPVLALGGYLQTTACLGVGQEAFLSQHVGDLGGEPARAFLAEVTAGLEGFLEVEARTIAIDPHPDYPSSWLGERLAEARNARVLPVQHHLAHAAAVLGEHGRFPALGERSAALILDGTGWGPDGSAWGGEWLLLEGDLGWRRLAHTTPLPLVGGERAVQEPWRVAVAALLASGRSDLLPSLASATGVSRSVFEPVCTLAKSGGWPLATGAGRFFEAAGALLGVGHENHWEGECAVRLEALASRVRGEVAPWSDVALDDAKRELPTAQLLAAACQRRADGEEPSRVAAGLHASFCALAAQLCAAVLPADVRSVAVGGGCLVNRLLREGLRSELEARGFKVLLPSALPPGDGALSYGQCVVAAASLARGASPMWIGGR